MRFLCRAQSQVDDLADRFDEVQQVADQVARTRNAVSALLALARLVGRQYAYSQILGRLGAEGRHHEMTLDVWRSWVHDFGLDVDAGGTERIWLGWDPVVTRPWRLRRMSGSLDRLATGPQGAAHEWEYKPLNHRVNLWLPMRLGDLWNGNHSLTVGILNSGGDSVSAANVIDMSPLYGRFQDLGVRRRWLRRAEFRWWDAVAEESVRVDDWRLAALFEIGRRLHDLGHDGRLRDWRPVP